MKVNKCVQRMSGVLYLKLLKVTDFTKFHNCRYLRLNLL